MAATVHTYRSGEIGLFVNSYLVEGADGVVAVDAPLLLSDGRAFRARLEALGKPLLGVLVTHPHADHYKEGFEQFLEKRLAPATQELGIERETEITVTPLHNLFAPRLAELPGLVPSLPGAPGALGSAQSER